MTFKIGIVVGEPSGDLIASKLILAIKEKIPNCVVEGIAGEHLISVGCIQLFPMSELSVMGFVEPLKKLPRILSIRKQVFKYFINNPPDVFIGVDAPDFNLSLESKIHKEGITVVHFVSPTVWAWRSGRLKIMQKSLNLMLTLFPFEKEIYDKEGIPAVYTGHPLVQSINRNVNKIEVKEKLRLDLNKQVVAVLPGSRDQELKNMIEVYLKSMKIIYGHNPNTTFIMPLINEVHQEFVLEHKALICPECPLLIIIDKSHLAMEAADLAICTSGTATLELMLHNVPMVVAYKTGFFTYLLLKMIVKTKFVALPNIIANKQLVDEFIQFKAKPLNIANGILELMQDPVKYDDIKNKLILLSDELNQDFANIAADAVINVSNYNS